MLCWLNLQRLKRRVQKDHQQNLSQPPNPSHQDPSSLQIKRQNQEVTIDRSPSQDQKVKNQKAEKQAEGKEGKLR